MKLKCQIIGILVQELMNSMVGYFISMKKRVGFIMRNLKNDFQ